MKTAVEPVRGKQEVSFYHVKFELPVSCIDIQVQILIRQFGFMNWKFTGEVGPGGCKLVSCQRIDDT